MAQIEDSICKDPGKVRGCMKNTLDHEMLCRSHLVRKNGTMAKGMGGFVLFCFVSPRTEIYKTRCYLFKMDLFHSLPTHKQTKIFSTQISFLLFKKNGGRDCCRRI